MAFRSDATNLVPNDTNGQPDIFVLDRGTNTIARVSVATGGAQANGPNEANPVISANGRYVAFVSFASNLVSGDTNAEVDVFVHDRQTHTTTRVSVSSQGVQGNDSSGSTAQVSMSADGRYVAYFSHATNLVPNDTNLSADAFVHDRATGVTSRASLTDRDAQVPNLGLSQYLSLALSADGLRLAFTTTARMVSGETDDMPDVFVRDLEARQTTRESGALGGVAPNGPSLAPVMSNDGDLVAFSSAASNLVAGDSNGALDIFIRDRVTLTATRVSLTNLGSQAAGSSFKPSLSPDGRFLVFLSTATNFGPHDSNATDDAFVRDLITGRVSLVSRTLQGPQTLNRASHVAMSADHRVVGYEFFTPGAPVPSSELIVRAATPKIDGLWPRAGSAAGGTSLQIVGEGLADGVQVSFNGRPRASPPTASMSTSPFRPGLQERSPQSR